MLSKDDAGLDELARCRLGFIALKETKVPILKFLGVTAKLKKKRDIKTDKNNFFNIKEMIFIE